MGTNSRIKIAGYAKRIFFNDNIEYRNFSPDLVGFQLTSEGGTTLFTNGNFSISTNLDPKPNVLFTQGTKSKFFTLDDISTKGETQTDIQKNVNNRLNVDLTNPLSYVWYGSTKELIRSSIIEIENEWPAAIYVDNKVGSVTGNNITEYVYDISSDESTFKVSSNFFNNPYNIKYTIDSKFTSTENNDNPLRNLTLESGSYVIEHNGISKNIKGFTGSTQKTNSEVTLVVDGNPFPELTGIYIPQFSFLVDEIDGSIPYFIKPNESEIERFFTGLDDFQRTILNREVTPKYRAEIISSNYTDEGVLLTSKKVYDFPVLIDGYNLNLFDSFYLSYLDNITKLGENLDETKTDTLVRKYTTEAINSFDTLPTPDKDDLTLNGEKATKLIRIYGVEFDYIKKYINGIKFAHVVTYDKKNNIQDSLVKDLSHMLGLEPINFINDTTFSKLYLPSNGGGEFSGTSTNLSQSEIETELYRRLILNIAWIWKSKGTRKAIEFLFRYIGAPESLVNFNEYVVLVDKPLDIEEIKKLLYLYTGEVNLDNIPYDENGYPNPPINGDIVITDFIDSETGEIVENGFAEMYFQKAGGWYRETYGSSGSTTILKGNNPHVGPYDGGSEYLQYFSKCYIPNFDNEPTVVITAQTLQDNYFINYNYGFFNGISADTEDIYTTQLTLNTLTGKYQPIDDCLDVYYNIIETPLQNDGKTTLQQAFSEAESNYNEFLELIKEDSYLVYSPEWQVVKNNYELSLNNCLTEVATEDCGINQTLEICLIQKEVPPFTCEQLNLNICKPFIYYTNDDDIKVSFDEFKECCESNKRTQYVSYINEEGRYSEYCSSKAPCIGKPIEVMEDGIVVFDITSNNSNRAFIGGGYELENNNNQPSNSDVYTVNGLCYQVVDLIKVNLVLVSPPFNGISIEQFFDVLTNVNNPLYSDYFIVFTTFLTGRLIEEVNCEEKTIISSPECCAWYGYDYQIVKINGNCFIACVDRNEDDGCIQNEFIEETLIPSESNNYENYTIPYIDYTNVNTGYVELQNPVGSLQEYYSTEINGDCFEESVIIKGFAGGNSLVQLPYSLFEDPNFMNPSNWEVYLIDEEGRVSYTPATFESDFILDWNYSETQLTDLYQLVTTELGYLYNDELNAAVDPDYFTCEDVNSVSVVFASEKWQGFKLPKLEDCSCTIDFSLDYMIKYNTKQLEKCAETVTCFPAIINENTIQNFNCLNFIVFTENQEDSDSLVNSWNTDNSGNSIVIDPVFQSQVITPIKNPNTGIPIKPIISNGESQQIWQNTNIIEPDVECCTAIGGDLVPYSQWENINQQWLDTINENYLAITNNDVEFLEGVDYSYQTYVPYINNYQNVISDLNELPLNCFNFDLTLPECDINFDCYIQTQNICSLQIPLQCGLWTKLYHNYITLSNQIRENITQYNLYLRDCKEEIGDNSVDKVNGQKSVSTTQRYSTKNSNEISFDNLQIEKSTTLITNEINQKSGDNLIIQKALTNVNTPLDCTVYENTLTELRNFDYNSYCNTIVYGSPDINDGTKTEEYNNCIKSKTLENQNNEVINSQLLESCRLKNSLEQQLISAKFENNLTLVNKLEKQINEINQNINRLTTNYNNNISFNESQQNSSFLENDIQNTINKTAELLNTTPNDITNESNNLILTDTQKVTLNVIYNKNISQISNLNRELVSNSFLKTVNTEDKIILENQTENEIDDIKEEYELVETDCDTLVVDEISGTTDCCDIISVSDLEILNNSFNSLSSLIKLINKEMYSCHNSWYETLSTNYENYINQKYYVKYFDDLKINFKLFVNNTNLDTNTNIDTGLTYLPYTESINPIWEWDPTNGYSGVILEGNEQLITTIKESVFSYLTQQDILYNSDIFEPSWQKLNFTIPECVCDDLRRLYPNKEFFFSVELENYECDLCLLVDNIQVNVTDCQTQRILSINDCMVPQLNCVIDNKKSWVYYDDGVVKKTIYPNGDCNTGSETNYEIVTLGAEQERLWLDLEYRYTDYDIQHSDLLINVKNASFSIDPAKAIECDVFNYWKNIDCDNCPTKCLEDSKVFEDDDDFLFQDCNTYIFEDQSTEHSVVFSGEVLSSGYTLNFDDIETTGLTFSCSTYTDSLTQSVLSLKNKYYTLTSDYIESLDATYQQLLDKGESLDNFYIQENNCGTDTIVINDNSSLNNLFGIITENYDGTISIFENYLYTGTTPYSGGILTEVLSGTGVTAQTYNQKLHIDQDCCESLNDLLNGEGVGGLGLGKNYQWDTTNCFCTWKPLDDCDKCKGDCEYCGQKKECVDGFATGETYSVCINPLDYLDIQPSEINIKSVFDQLVQTNLIDVKSRQTISDYPTLRMFYDLYLTASNCGEDLSGKFTYNTMFEFMDKIGDYWLDLIEQVVPATTIWEGCDNSGKIYRNTIFDNNKFNYKRYSLNFIDTTECPLSGQTDFSIGSQNIESLVVEKPIYPFSSEINQLKIDILEKKINISVYIKTGDTYNSRLCSLNLQDLTTPNLQNQKDEIETLINLNNELLETLNGELVELNSELDELQKEYLKQQNNFYMNFTSCSGITENLINAQNNLSGFTEGTTNYERQRNFIAGLRDKYTKCVRQSNTLLSEYNTVFITQIYDSNEYEGNVIITGDSDWEDGGPFYNKELIHNCTN